MIGDVVLVNMPFYDAIAKENSFKRRPSLVIGDAASNDYTVLPVSKVDNPDNISAEYDVKIEPQVYPLLNLDLLSYVRTHKATTVHRAAIAYKLSSMRENYPELYLTVVEKYERFTKSLIVDAL